MSERIQNRLSRRSFLRMTAVAGGLGLAAACAAPGAPAADTGDGAVPSGEMVDLRLSAWADVQDAVVYDNMVNAFMAANDDLNVTVEQYPGGYYQKIQANFAGNTSADILYYQGWQFQSYAENGVLAALDDFIAATDSGAQFPRNENYDSMTQWDGSTYMTPTDTGPLVIYYNKDIFDAKGVAYPAAGWTWEEFKSTIETLSFEEGGSKTYGWAQAAGWNGSYGRCANFMRRNGHVEWDTIIEPTEARWDHEDVISGLQFVVYDTIANGWSPGPDVIAGGGVGVDTGRVAMVLEGPWFMPRLFGELATTEEGINFDVALAPVGVDDTNYTFGHVHGHCITSPSEHKDEAWRVVDFILSDEGQAIIANGGRLCGTPRNIENLWAPIASEKYNFENTGAFVNSMAEGATPVVFGEGAELHAYGGAAITSLWDKLLGLQETADTAVKTANEEIQGALDRYHAERA